MKRCHFLLAVLMAAAALPAVAQVSVHINLPGVVQAAPPPPRYERMPGPRAGQVWVPGHWQWNGRDYAWRGGNWQAARRDHAYAPGAWVRADDGWRWREGDWRRAERRDDGRREERRREERRHDRHDDRRGHGHGHGHDHCPPGQAKKGRC